MDWVLRLAEAARAEEIRETQAKREALSLLIRTPRTDLLLSEQIAVKVTEVMASSLDAAAAKMGVSRADVIRDFIERGLRAEKVGRYA